VVLCRYQTKSLILSEGHILRVFENRVLSRIFGPKGDEATGGWRKLQNEELRDLYSSPAKLDDRVEEDEVGGACGENGGK
jgi:hypothetical protein